MASNIRAMPENEKPPARRVDVYCNSNEPKSGLARDLGNCLQSRNVPFGTSGDCELMTGILLLKKDKIFVQK